MTQRRIALLVVGAAIAGLGVALAHGSPRAVLRADQKGPLHDTDGDLLPDNLEWITLTSPNSVDSDADQRDDFLEAVLYEPPVWNANGPAPDGDGHSVRVIVNTVRLADNRDHVYLNLLFRVATKDPRQIQVVETFLETNGITVPIGNLIGATGMGVAARPNPGGGFLAIVAARLALLEEIRALLPCTVGARVLIGNSDFKTGTMLELVGEVPVAVAPVTQNQFVFQSLVPPENLNNSMWVPNQVCLFQLVQIATTPESVLYEVTGAKCQPAFVLCCDSAGCARKEGGLVRMPNGLRVLRGG